MDPQSLSRPPRAIAVTACSALFFDHYVDLLDSLAAVGLTSQFELGVLDLGLQADQIASLQARGATVVAGDWPLTPPAGHDRPEYVAFAGKPFARDYFPGYDLYLWIDADMWVQSADFWHEMVDGALQHGCVVSVEQHPSYRPMPVRERIWMLRHLTRSFGPAAAASVARFPMVNNGLYALHADAPHWELWQQRFARMVARTRRMIAIDQLAMFAMIHLDKPDTVLAGARHNWVCSLATPHWHESMQKFVMPNEESLPISVLHVTTPARMRPFAVPVVGGLAAERYLHRPGGRIMAALTGTDEQRPADPAPAVQPLDHLRTERRVEVADS